MIAIGVVIVLGLGAGYAGVCALVYLQLTRVTADCSGDVQDPTSFTVAGVDTTPYRMPPAADIRFPARGDGGVTVAGWWEPVAAVDAPTVVLVHGLNGCRRNGPNLLAAGMLHRHGIAVLLIDVRNHGDATVVDGRTSAGNLEYLDVLGAVDWLRAQGVPAARIGLLGFSFGAATVMIAAGEEPAVAAVWADSSYADIRALIRDELRRVGYPTFLDVGAIAMGNFVTGRDLTALSPLAATAKIAGRAVFLTQGSEDERVDPASLRRLAAGVEAAGGSVETWQVDGARHVEALQRFTAEYERRMVGFFGVALGGVPSG